MNDKQIETGNNEPVEFEEAVSKTEFGRCNIALLVVCGISLMSVIMETLSMSFIVPAAKCDLDLTLSDKGTLSSIGFLGVVVSSLLWGFIGDTTGRKNMVLITSYISFFAGIASSLAPYVWLLILLRFINCFFIGGPSAVIIGYLGEFHGLKYRARMIALSATFVGGVSITLAGLAWIILPMEWSVPITWLNITWRPWRLLIILYGLPSFISATCLLFLPESPKYLWAVGKQEEALSVLRNIYALNTGKSKDEYPVTKLVMYNENVRSVNGETVDFKKNNIIMLFFKLMKLQLYPIFCPPLLWRTFMTSFLQFGVFAGYSGMVMWFPEILNKVTIYMEQNNSTLVSVCQAMEYKINVIDILSTEDCSDSIDIEVFKISLAIGGAFVFTYIFIGVSINYTGKKRLLAGLMLVCGISGVAVHFMESYLLISILSGLFIVGGAGVTILNTAVVDLFPTQYRSIAMAVSLMAGRTGAMVSSHFFGYLLEYSCSSVFYIFGGFYVLLGMLSFLLPST